MSFLPEHYTAVPRQCFYHTVTYLNTVDAGNAALMVVPGSAELSRSIVATLSEAELEQLRGPQYGLVLAEKVRPHIDTSQGVELLMEEGDTVVLDCMWCASPPAPLAQPLRRSLASLVLIPRVGSMHSASASTDFPRWAIFHTFHTRESARFLVTRLRTVSLKTCLILQRQPLGA